MAQSMKFPGVYDNKKKENFSFSFFWEGFILFALTKSVLLAFIDSNFAEVYIGLFVETPGHSNSRKCNKQSRATYAQMFQILKTGLSKYFY